MRTTVSASVVGMKYYGFTPGEAREILRARPSLTREPQNSHDTNAIAVTIDGRTIGHIDRKSASILAPLLDSGATYEIEIGSVLGQSISAKVTVVRDAQPVAVPRVCGTGTVGIYAIWAGDDPYVGQSIDVQNRLAQHWDELHRGIHQNPQLRRLWVDLGPARFSAKVVEVAPNLKKSLEIARWLHNRECHWIEKFGGLRRVINAAPPKPVLNETAKRELQSEREAARPTLKVLERKCTELSHEHEKLCSAIDNLGDVVTKATRFWGIFTSRETEIEAEAARQKIPVLQGKARKLIDERIALQGKIFEMKRHLFIDD